MNTNHLKKFAQEARRKLLEQVGAKLTFVLTTDSVELREKTEQLKQLRQELGRTTKEQLIEKVAYTWFNRLMALRFMDANDYQPLGIRIITPKDGYTIPELLDEAKRGNISEELKVNKQKIYDLLDNKIPSTNPQNEVFKELLIAACNHLNTTFPFLFEKINDYTELLLPDDLTSDFSIVMDVRDGMLIEDCKNVEIIGWLYQFYISEKKDEVFASKSKVKKEDIPAATQLFTPRWIVEYMVQNTLGKLWLQNRSKSRLREHMQYFIESESLDKKDYLKINSPEEIKFIDPASGSGHILVYAFDLFTKIYEEEGYNIGDIAQLIIEKNLYGYEIDERAAQLTGLALLMKAREYERRVLRKNFKPNNFCFQDLNLSKIEISATLNSSQISISDKILDDLINMQQATNFGSLINPYVSVKEILEVSNKLEQSIFNVDVFQSVKIKALQTALGQLLKLSENYHCVVTNPPYMSGGMNAELSDFVKTNYTDSRTDLMACFVERCLKMLKSKGFLGMINQHSWMFLGSFEKLRHKLVKSVFFDTMLHLGARTFPEIGGEVVQNTTFTFWNAENDEALGKYIRLVDFDNSESKRNQALEAINNLHGKYFYNANQDSFHKISGCPIAYWASKKTRNIFQEFESLEKYSKARIGMMTTDNIRFLRQWYENPYNKIGFNLPSINHAINSHFKWFPYNKGGSYRKWYGNNELNVNWENAGFEIKRNGMTSFRGKDYYFRSGITWSFINTSKFGVRYKPKGFIFDIQGSSAFPEDEELEIVASYLCSCVSLHFLSILNPTLSYQANNLNCLPYINSVKIDPIKRERIKILFTDCVNISKLDWDRSELSWEFRQNQLVQTKQNQNIELEESYDLLRQFWSTKFFQVQQHEEELNQIFIEIYDLADELSPTVSMEDITILQDILDRRLLLKMKKNIINETNNLSGNHHFNLSLPFLAKEVLTEFISYSIGCLFGRYSLDKEGLILANQRETLQDYINKIGKSPDECSIIPDKDNIIPILDDEWFEDDIVGRFNQFLKVTYGEKNFNKNLAFIEEQIGKDIRDYFIKDFYPDHIKRYKKRPIYWMFSSPKGSFNVLIYIHRYTPDTVSIILNKYLKEFIGKLNTRKEHLERVKETGSASDKSKAIKESDNIQKMLVELHEYERDILYPLATERIEIDLDDGVLVNYNKFGKAVKEVNGLNDPPTKKKVKQFDWIDTSQIK